jgi:type IV pilus assembly protein PilZ
MVMTPAKTPKQGLMPLIIRDKNALLAAYMPFLKSGGVFIPTDKSFELGDEVFLVLSLMDEPQRYAVTGKVVWITPKAALGGRPAGIGIQFNGVEGDLVQKKIETYLAGTTSERPTHTM